MRTLISKRAGLLKIPEKLTQEIWDWVKQQYAVRLYPHVEIKNEFMDWKTAQKYEEELREYLNKLTDVVEELANAKNLNEEIDLLEEFRLLDKPIEYPKIATNFTYKIQYLSLNGPTEYYFDPSNDWNQSWNLPWTKEEAQQIQSKLKQVGIPIHIEEK